MRDKRVSDMTDDELRALAGATGTRPDDRELLMLAAEALLDCAKASLTVKLLLDQPYPDAPQWTPYTRWIERPADQAVTLAVKIRKHLEETMTTTLHELARAAEVDMSGPAGFPDDPTPGEPAA